MIDFVKNIKSLIKVEEVHIDNNVFKLHYKFTVIMLIVFSVLLTSKQYFGEPIDCDVDYERKKIIDTYCWIYGTYIVKNSLKEEILTGLGPYVDPRKNSAIHSLTTVNNKDTIITQKYYQWVCLVFCFQALLFYVPRYLWKTWEGGRIRLLSKDLGGPLISLSWNKESRERLVSYMLSGNYSHNLYALRFSFCELLNFGNVVAQILLLDWFLTGQFTGYGIAIATINGINPMTAVFPKLTKCTYYRFGPSGTLEDRDALCILPLNIVNEKLFLFLWFWLLFLLVVSFYCLVYRIIIIGCPRIRMYLLMAHAQFLSKKSALVITKKLTFGDFFFLYQLGKNMNPLVYKDLLVSIADVLLEKTSLSYNPEITLAV